jgi:OOP family OmpA-OmpF porin
MEFTATLSPEGAVQLRGRVGSEISRQTADSFARAHFGFDAVYTAARVDDALPADWGVRALAGLEVLSMLASGAVRVLPDAVHVTGQTGRQDAGAAIAGLLGEKLGDDESFEIDVTYVERLDPTLGIPSPEECEAGVVEIIGDRKLTFEPGSATLDASAENILDELADLLKLCGEIPMEIGGHTDSQGRESMNRQLSRDRAQAVYDALRLRLVPVKTYRVRGYGEADPIADNDTEDGREANRRIEFRLIAPEPEEAPVQTGDEGSGGEDAVGAEGTRNDQD